MVPYQLFVIVCISLPLFLTPIHVSSPRASCLSVSFDRASPLTLYLLRYRYGYVSSPRFHLYDVISAQGGQTGWSATGVYLGVRIDLPNIPFLPLLAYLHPWHYAEAPFLTFHHPAHLQCRLPNNPLSRPPSWTLVQTQGSALEGRWLPRLRFYRNRILRKVRQPWGSGPKLQPTNIFSSTHSLTQIRHAFPE